MTSEAQDALRAKLPYSHAFIRASVAPSRATLRGVVEWPYQKEQAELAVRAALPEIKDVRNLILDRVKRTRSAGLGDHRSHRRDVTNVVTSGELSLAHLAALREIRDIARRLS